MCVALLFASLTRDLGYTTEWLLLNFYRILSSEIMGP